MSSGFLVDPDAATELYEPLLMRARARIGTTLRSKWRLDVLLGVGGMASVYAATHRNGTRAAVKILHTELSLDAQVRGRFVREGYLANAVGHDGAVKVMDDDTAEDGSLFLVTELLDGETLEERRLRSGGKLSEDDVLSVADQLLDVLVAAHAKGVVHRDLKPENLFLTRTGLVKVLDFGIARLRELSSATTATRSGESMGTPAYMPPEQARGLWDEVDARSDLWAVGATMFHLLTGRLVHDEGRTANEQLLEAMTKPAPPLASVNADASPAVAHLVDRALAFERNKRWPDARRMQEAARGAYHDRYGVPLSTSPRLTVPETVPNRTLSSASGALTPRLPTTGQPVEKGRSAATPSRTFVAALVFAGMVLLGVAAAGIVAVVRAGHEGGEGAPARSVAGSTSATAPSATAADRSANDAAATLAPPEIIVTDLPSAATGTSTSPSAPTGKAARRTAPPAASAPTPGPTSKQNCHPPYVIDSVTGKKTFKMECL